jgi:hypothetical protein
MRPSLRRSHAGILLLALGCTTLKPVPPTVLQGPNPPPSVQAAVTSVGWVTIHEPRLVSSDTLAGLVDGQFEAIPLSSVWELRVREAAPVHTALLIGLPIVAVGGIFLCYELCDSKVSGGCVYDPTLNAYEC